MSDRADALEPSMACSGRKRHSSVPLPHRLLGYRFFTLGISMIWHGGNRLAVWAAGDDDCAVSDVACLFTK